nr:hypothetical protein [uncultured Actinoplanes sp.]
MSRQFRYRMTALALGGLIFGAPMLANGTASAEQLSETGRQVTFEGGSMLGLSCRSQPDIESMTVPADSTVRVVNRTGYSARLELGGDTKGTLPDDAATDVVFRRGTTAVVLKPNCALGDDTSPVMVTASPSAAAMPDPTPAPSGGQASLAIAPSGSGNPSGSLVPGPASAAERPSSARRSSAHQPGLRTSSLASMPQGGATARPKTKTKVKAISRTAGDRTHTFAGMPPGDARTLATDVPRADLPAVAGESDAAAPAAPPTESAAAEPVAAMAPMPEGAPIGLLAVIASVCVLGVGAAAIRAIVSQRANRAKLA